MKKALLLLLLCTQLLCQLALGQTLTPLAPVADAYVRSDAYAAINYGADPTLQVKGTTTSGYTRNTYLKFSLENLSGNLTAAKLRLYGSNVENTASVSVSVYNAITDNWTETTITYNNRPSHPSTALRAVSVNNVVKYYEWDVTAFVKSQYTGDKIVSLVVKDAAKLRAQLTFNSRESSANGPQLLITTDAPPANQPPVLGSIGSKSITAGNTLAFTATASDPDAGQTKTFSLIDNNNPATTAAITPSGAFSWTPTEAGTYSFKVKVSDNATPPLSDEEDITITVTPNHAPALDAIDPKTIIVGQPFAFTATAADADEGQTKTFSLTDNNSPATSAAITSAGAFSWTPPATGTYSFTIQVADNGSPVGSDSKTFTLTVTDPPPNQAPVLEAIPTQSAMAGQAFTLTAHASDDPAQTLSFSLVDDANNTPPPGAAITAAGAFSWTPAAQGSYQVTVRVSDNGSPALSAQGQFIINVTQPNQPPVLAHIDDQSVTLGQTVSFPVTVSDPDAGQVLNVYLIDAPDDATFEEDGSVAGQWNFSWTPTQSGSFKFTVHVSDDSDPAATDEQVVDVTVNDVNEAPVLTPIGNKEAAVGQTLTFTAKASDVNSGQTKTFSLVASQPGNVPPPAGASIDAATGVFSWKPAQGGSYPLTVRVSDNGSPVLSAEETITITVSASTTTLTPQADAFVRLKTFSTVNYGTSDSLLIKTYNTNADYTRNIYVKFSLSGLSGSVTAAKLRLYGRNIDNTTSIAVSVYSVTTDSWTETAITAGNAPAASSSTALSTVGVGSTAGYYEWDVTAFVQGQLAGDKVVSLVLKNASNQNKNVAFNSREKGVNIPQLVVSTTTAPTNLAPVLTAIGNKSTSVGSTLSFTATASDADAGQTQTFSLVGTPPSGASITAAGAFSWTPSAPGTYSFTVRVTDNGSPVLYDEEQFPVTVSGPSSTTTFTSSQSQPIPNPGTVSVPVVVSGLPTSIDQSSYGLQSVSVQLTHPTDAELTLQLKSPDGKTIYLFRKSPGVNINTTFDAVSPRFIDNNEIAAYSGSFTSGYRPRQDLALLNNGQNPNGTWNLVVKDDNSASAAGQLTGVSLVFGASPALPLLTSSTLPIIKIYTQNSVDIVDDPKVLADMYIINNAGGAVNYANQTTYQYQGKIGIEIRGNSSASLAVLPKRQYGFETRLADGVTSTDVALLGMPAKDDWILSAVMSDKSLMRNVLSYQLARDMGYWASRTKFVEVLINDEYRGVFIFEEKIKRDKNRVNVDKIATTDVTEPNVTGGYIFSVDDLDAGDKTWTTKYDPKPDNPYKIIYPKPEDWVAAQQTYIKNYVWDFEDALHGTGFQDPTTGFRKYIDDKTFMDFFIINEAAKNGDAYRYSTYFNKKRGGKLAAGPVWDFDKGFRNDAPCNDASPSGYSYLIQNVCGNRVVPWWWARLLEDPKYKADLICRYNTWRQNKMSLQRINFIIDSAAAVLNAGAQQRNFIRWNTWGKYVVWIPQPYATSYAMEISALKQWIADRLAWMDNDLGTCTVNMLTKNPSGNLNELEDAKAVGTVYPSPFKDHLSVVVNTDKAQPVTIQLLDVSGKVLYQKVYALQKGAQSIHLDLSGKHLTNGMYLLYFRGSDMNVMKKLLKE